jgi:ketosteroid isomerase-like protein
MSNKRFRLRRTRLFLAPVLAATLFSASAMADEVAEITRLMRAGQQEEALKRADSHLARVPRDAQVRFLKGVMLAETRPAEAISIFSRLTEDFPRLPEPYNNLAVLYAASGQYEKASAALDKAMRTNPAYATAYKNLGDVHARLASLEYEKALQVDPGAAAKVSLTLMQSISSVAAAPAQVSQQATSPAAPSPGTAPLPKVASNTPASSPDSRTAQAQAGATPTTKPDAGTATLAKAEPQAPLRDTRTQATPAPQPAKETAVAMAPKPEPRTSPVAKQEAAPPARTTSVPAKPAAEPLRAARADKPERPERAERKDAKARAAQEVAAERSAVLGAVSAWARAWSERDVPAYLAHYAPDFEPGRGLSRKAWAEERQARILGKGRIEVRIEKPQVEVNGNSATVRFHQIYVSDRLSASSRKTLSMERQKNGKWQIAREIAG